MRLGLGRRRAANVRLVAGGLRQQQLQDQCRMTIASSGAGISAVDRVRELLGCSLKITTPSGRTLTGQLQCLDKQGNLVLGDASEQLVVQQQERGGGGSEVEARRLGMVLVPPAQQQRVELLRVEVGALHVLTRQPPPAPLAPREQAHTRAMRGRACWQGPHLHTLQSSPEFTHTHTVHALTPPVCRLDWTSS